VYGPGAIVGLGGERVFPGVLERREHGAVRVGRHGELADVGDVHLRRVDLPAARLHRFY
jgi:hypothetical protein